MAADNPLLSLDAEIPFDRIRAEHVEPAISALLSDAKRQIDEIANDAAPRTYESTLGALERATEKLERTMSIVAHLEAVATTDALRSAYDAVKPRVSELYTSIPLDARLWAALQALASSNEGRTLEGARGRFLHKTMDDFRRHGAELDAAGKKRLAEIDVELTMLTTKFSQNVLDSTNAFELVIEDETKLAGLPESARAAAKQSAEQKGKTGYRFTLQAPSLVPLLTYLDDAEIRRTVWIAYNERATAAPHANVPLIERVLELRHEKARLLGFAHFADLVLDDRMAKKGETAERFIGELRDRTETWFARENEALEKYRRAKVGKDTQPMQAWDLGYWAEKQRRELYDFDEEELRPYFAVDAVLGGLFETVKRLYDVRIEPADDLPVWDETVRAFRFHGADGSLAGAFYADLFPRENKRGGAWMSTLHTAVPPEPHLALFCANVTPAIGSAPALLTHGEVETLFHEFGHLMHQLLSKVPVRSLAGTNVAWDFVELPSQIMENWCWEREALDFFARHHESGAPIPEELHAKMVRARTYRAANAQMRQLGFATLDLALHMRWIAESPRPAVLSYAREILKAHSAAPLPESYAMLCGFGHIFGSSVGYAAGYYSYKWAEVLDADAFTRFKQRGVFDADVGAAFRDAILSRGDSRDPLDLYREFMGREPSVEALFERQGLLSTSLR
jgi:oligopeptidase A